MGKKYGRHVAGGIHARREWHSSRSGFSGAAYLEKIQVSCATGSCKRGVFLSLGQPTVA